jgi:hypothetical protein
MAAKGIQLQLSALLDWGMTGGNQKYLHVSKCLLSHLRGCTQQTRRTNAWLTLACHSLMSDGLICKASASCMSRNNTYPKKVGACYSPHWAGTLRNTRLAVVHATAKPFSRAAAQGQLPSSTRQQKMAVSKHFTLDIAAGIPGKLPKTQTELKTSF